MIYLDVFMFYKLASTYLYIATRHILMALLWPSGQSGSELLNSRQKYAILGADARKINLPILA